MPRTRSNKNVPYLSRMGALPAIVARSIPIYGISALQHMSLNAAKIGLGLEKGCKT